MKILLIALLFSYLVTWCSGVYISRQRRLSREKARNLHLGLSLIT